MHLSSPLVQEAILYYSKFADHATFKFGRSNPMALDVDDIIHPPGDLVVSVLIPQGPVPTEIETRVRTIVGVEELLMISVDGSGHSRPRLPHAEITRNTGTSKFSTL